MNYNMKKATEIGESMFWYWTFIACGWRFLPQFFPFLSSKTFSYFVCFAIGVCCSDATLLMVFLFLLLLLNWFAVFVIFQWIFLKCAEPKRPARFHVLPVTCITKPFDLLLYHRIEWNVMLLSLPISMGFSFRFFLFYFIYIASMWHGYPPVMHHVSTNTYRTTSLSNEN